MTEDRRVMALSAAGIYAGAVVLQVIEVAIPGGAEASSGPWIVALALSVLIAVWGARIPKWILFLAGPAGAGLIGWALATTHGYSDGAVLYVWPVLWTSACFGVRGAVAIVLCVAVAHGVALLEMDPAQTNLDRWIDVVVAVSVVAAVVRFLADRNRRLYTDLVAEARTDSLTGLLNRRGMQERLEVELARAARDGTSIAVVLFDIDGFKDVNDQLGHDVGDRLLAVLGALMASELRGVDIAARLGGDEFAAFMPNRREAEGVALAERIRRGFAADASMARAALGVPSDVAITLSAGVACASGHVDDNALRAKADEALYAAKSGGRDRVSTADSTGTKRGGYHT